jgi:hypothetical protein
MMLLNWLRKKMGYHVCEEFTQWIEYERLFERQAYHNEPAFIKSGVVRFTTRWQERKCTICGKIQQEVLDR